MICIWNQRLVHACVYTCQFVHVCRCVYVHMPDNNHIAFSVNGVTVILLSFFNMVEKVGI